NNGGRGGFRGGRRGLSNLKILRVLVVVLCALRAQKGRKSCNDRASGPIPPGGFEPPLWVPKTRVLPLHQGGADLKANPERALGSTRGLASQHGFRERGQGSGGPHREAFRLQLDRGRRGRARAIEDRE